VFELLARLVEKSLVVVEQSGEEARYRLLDTIRQFAAERLEAAAERRSVEARHRLWCQELAEAHDPATAAGARNRSLRRLERDHDNLRVALASGLHDDPQAALRLAVTLWRFWLDRHVFVEGARWLEDVIAAVPEESALRVEALLALAALNLRLGRTPAQLVHADDALAAGRRVGNRRMLVEAMIERGLIALASGGLHPGEVDDALAEAVEVAARAGADDLVASALHARVHPAWYLDDGATARERGEEALERLDALRDDETPFFLGITLGFAVLPEGPGGRPRPLYEETILLFHRYARSQAIAHALSNLAYLDRADGDGDRAAGRLHDSLARFRAAGDVPGEGLALTHLGNLARSTGRYDDGLASLEQALAVRASLGDLRAASVVTGDLAMLHSAAGAGDRADELFEATCRSFRAADDFPALAGTLGNWAACLESAGDLAGAAPVYEEASRMWEAAALNPRVAWLAASLADLYERLGRDDEAARKREVARVTFAEQGNEHGPALLGWEPAPTEA
jgi:tetratricopeptide (TPR) repeat protein